MTVAEPKPLTIRSEAHALITITPMGWLILTNLSIMYSYVLTI